MHRALATLILVLTVLCGPGAPQAFELTLLHVNDSHSYLDPTTDKIRPQGKETYAKLGGWARLTTLVDKARAERPNVLLLHAGDAVQGDLYFLKYGGRPEMEFLDRLGFAAMTLGNHEFDKGPDFLANMLGYAKLPVLSANMDASEVPALASRVKPYIVATVGGEKIGVIGLTIRDTGVISAPGKVAFSDEAQAADLYVRELQARGVNKIVLLTHVGFGADKRLAAKVRGVDVIVGGHSHTLLGGPDGIGALGLNPAAPYPAVVKGADGDDVYVVTAWKWGRVLGRLDLTFDDEGRVTRAESRPELVLGDTFRRKDAAGKKAEVRGADREALLAAIAQNPEAVAAAPDAGARKFLGPFAQGVEAMRTEVIGRAVLPLPHIRVPGVTDSGERLPHGSLLAPLVCRSMLDKLNATGSPADIALMNGGGVRISIPEGDITVGTVFSMMPFNNTLFVLKLTGKEVRTALETGVARGGGAFPYVGGLRFAADMNQPEGSRVHAVEVLGREGSWQSLVPHRTYSVVTNSYLASGGDGYEVLERATDRHDTGFVDSLVFLDFVKRKRTLRPLASTGVTYIPAH
ncbi:bifunctional metallophosphatase/5'-nucleotidase [Pseudodesulfovibrio indicus]|uniref:bifunctional metallophosphatase/5'-nucleotidase n=1 Tax=Pseudodesulfovibrio indicus TaxID=1716143 RepID=UPI002930A956|nr:bifunctional metallophosphatase/5'-nucleotidase [Pseudodesulfovibrio indicus]